jgi:hypothetical protein
MIMLSNRIAGTAWIDGLISRYGVALRSDEKTRLLRCLIRTEDPRALPALSKGLEEEKERTIRLLAAGGLGLAMK